MQEIVTRQDAIASGLSRYFTGSPCGNGHLAEKITSNWKCVECKRIDEARWKLLNPDRVRENHARHLSNNQDRVKASKKKYRDNNKEKRAEYGKKYVQANKERIAARLKAHSAKNRKRIAKRMLEYNRKNRGLIAHLSNKYRASKKNSTPCWADLAAIQLIYEKAALLNMEVDHIIPLQGKTVSGLHVEANLQILSRHENRTKSSKFDSSNEEEYFKKLKFA